MSKILKILVAALFGLTLVASNVASAAPHGIRGFRATQGGGQRISGRGRRFGPGRNIGAGLAGVGLGLAAGLAVAGATAYPQGYGYDYGYPGYGYTGPYGGPYAQPGYFVQDDYPAPYIQYPYGAGLAPGMSAAPGAVGQYCATPIKTCQLYNPSYVGVGCSCKVAGGRSQGVVSP